MASFPHPASDNAIRFYQSSGKREATTSATARKSHLFQCASWQTAEREFAGFIYYNTIFLYPPRTTWRRSFLSLLPPLACRAAGCQVFCTRPTRQIDSRRQRNGIHFKNPVHFSQFPLAVVHHTRLNVCDAIHEMYLFIWRRKLLTNRPSKRYQPAGPLIFFFLKYLKLAPRCAIENKHFLLGLRLPVGCMSTSFSFYYHHHQPPLLCRFRYASPSEVVRQDNHYFGLLGECFSRGTRQREKKKLNKKRRDRFLSSLYSSLFFFTVCWKTEKTYTNNNNNNKKKKKKNRLILRCRLIRGKTC